MKIREVQINNPEYWDISERDVSVSRTIDGIQRLTSTDSNIISIDLIKKQKKKLSINETVRIFEHGGVVFEELRKIDSIT